MLLKDCLMKASNLSRNSNLTKHHVFNFHYLCNIFHGEKQADDEQVSIG